MAFQTENKADLSLRWLQPVLQLIQEGEYNEAYALVINLPLTPTQQIVTSIALLGQKKISQVNNILKDTPLLFEECASFEELITRYSFDIENLILLSQNNRLCFLEYLLLIIKLLKLPDTQLAVYNKLCDVAKEANSFGYQELLVIILKKLEELDNSFLQLIEYAAIVLYENSDQTTAAFRENLALELLKKALDKTQPGQEDHVVAYLKALRMLSTFKEPDFPLMNRIIDKLINTNHQSYAALIKFSLERFEVLIDNNVKSYFLDKAILYSSGLEDLIKKEKNTLAERLVLLTKCYIHFRILNQNIPHDLALKLFSESGPEVTINSIPEFIEQAYYINITITRDILIQISKWLLENTPNKQQLAEKILDPDFWKRHNKDLYYATTLEDLFLPLIGDDKAPKWKAFKKQNIYDQTIMNSANVSIGFNEGWSDSYMKLEKESNEPDRVTVERYTMVGFPDQCYKEKIAELKIKLTKEIPAITKALQKIKLAVSRTQNEFKLDINISAPTFALQDWRKSMKCSITDDSEELKFVLVPLKEGLQVIEIEFYYESARVGYLMINTQVLNSRFHPIIPQGKPGKICIMENPAAPSLALIKQKINPLSRTLRVEWDEVQKKIRYGLHKAGTNEVTEFDYYCKQGKEDIAVYFKELNALLIEIVTTANPSDAEWDSICINLQGLGYKLYQTLIPEKLAAETKQWQADSTVLISTNEQWIPWELIFDGDDFWGQKFTLARYPRLVKQNEFSEEDRPIAYSQKKLRRILNVVGGGVPRKEAERASKLFDSLSGDRSVSLLIEEPVALFAKSLNEADTIHCTCHGHLDPQILQFDKTRSQALNLTPAAVQILKIEPGCLVFVNACASSAPVLTFGNFCTFGWEFYRRGANAFIGTLGSIPTEYAIQFAENVYNKLFEQNAKNNLGTAIADARKQASRSRNLFWLLYCIYGDPNHTIEL